MRSFATFLLLLALCSCGSSPSPSAGNESKSTAVQNQTQNQNPAQAQNQGIEKFPCTILSVRGGNVLSFFENDIVDYPLPADSEILFGDNIVYRFTSSYKLYDKESTVEYFVIIFNFKKTVGETKNVKPGDIIGKTKDNIKILVFCKTIDPFLVINCSNLPYYYNDFYWFEATFLFPSQSSANTRWLSFEPTDNIEKILIDIADDAIKSDPGKASVVGKRYRFKTKLTEYPHAISGVEKYIIPAYDKALFNRNDVTNSISEFKAGPYKFILCWQKGFEQYLLDEYKLNNDLWIYGVIVNFNPFDNSGYIYIIDFKQETLEQMLENRLKIISLLGGVSS